MVGGGVVWGEEGEGGEGGGGGRGGGGEEGRGEGEERRRRGGEEEKDEESRGAAASERRDKEEKGQAGPVSPVSGNAAPVTGRRGRCRWGPPRVTMVTRGGGAPFGADGALSSPPAPR